MVQSSPKMSLSVQIASAIRHKSCPICLTHIDDRKAAVLSICMHVYCVDCIRKWSQLKRHCPLCNAHFHSWFFKSRVSTRNFEEERLPNLEEKNKRIEIYHHRGERGRFRPQRSARRVVGSVNQRSMPLPWRRSFGRPYDQERVLQWRVSVYDKGLKAVPLPAKNIQEQNILRSTVLKERMQQRIEPWIRRELQVILQDPDPTVIVHLASSLYILSLEEKLNASPNGPAADDSYIQQLRPFLQERAGMFWHELRCFAGSSLEMATYDSVVEYSALE